MRARSFWDRKDAWPTSRKAFFSAAITLLTLFILSIASVRATEAPDYTAVNSIFEEHCADCHSGQEPEGKFVIEDFESLMKGGEIGPALVPGKSAESLLIQMIEGKFLKDGKNKIMPPGKRKKLEPEQIALIKSWIDGGAHGPTAGTAPRELTTPKIVPTVTPRVPIMAIAYDPQSHWLATGGYGEVTLRSLDKSGTERKLKGITGSVNAVAFSPDGKYLFAAGGQPGLSGEVRQWQVADGTLVRTFQGHKDALYSAALSPDGRTLATGSYDQKIKLWDVGSGQEIKTLSGHNGAIYGLAFRPDGKILASVSGDRTVKLWDVAAGERRDTLAQSLKELYAVAFSPDGKRLVAGGVDNRIRIWDISASAAETTNPLLDSKYAHEGAILSLVFSSDGKLLLSAAEDNTVKVWDGQAIKERFLLESQPDWVHALTFINDNQTIVAGRMNGSIGFYDAETGKALPGAQSNSKPQATAAK